MRNVILVIFMLISLPAELFSQKLNFVFEQGLGSYRMNDLKEFNTMTLNSLPFEAKNTDNFPAYWNYKPSLVFSFNKSLAFGITCSYQTTGSRISRVDYSGEYSFDMKIRAFSPGVFAELYFTVNNIRISLNNETGIEYSKLRLTEYFKLNSSSTKDDYLFKSHNWYYEPTIRLSFPIFLFRFGIAAGYLVDLERGTLLNTESDNININLSDGKLATADWSGIRFSVTLSFDILKLIKLNKKDQNLNVQIKQ